MVNKSATGYGNKVYKLDDFIDNVEKVHPIAVYTFPRWMWLYRMFRNVEGTSPEYVNYASDSIKLTKKMSSGPGSSSSDMFRYENNLSPYVEMIVGKFLGGNPIPFVFPSTDAVDDFYSSQLATAALRSYWESQEVILKWSQAIVWAAVVGNVYFKQSYDASGGKLVDLITEKKKEGEVTFSVKSPFLVFPDYRVNNPKEREWYVEIYVVPKEKLGRYFSKKEIDGLVEDGTDFLPINTSSFGVDTGHQHGYRVDVATEPSYLVREYWKKPIYGVDEGFGDGEGRYMLRAGGKTLHDGPNPFPDLPYTQFSLKQPPGSMFGDGVIERLIPGNLKINSLTKTAMSNFKNIGNTIPLIPEGSSFKRSKDISGPEGLYGLIYNPNFPPPGVLNVSPLPANTLQFIQYLTERMNMLIGMTDISFGQLPTGAHGLSKLGMDSLMDSERSRFTQDSISLKSAMAAQALLALKLIQKFYTSERKAKITGPFGMQEVYSFIGSELSTESDIIIELRDNLGATKAMSADRMIQFFDRGIIGPEELIEFSDLKFTNMSQKISVIMNAKLHLQLIIEKDVMPPVSKYDDHQVSMAVFKQFIRSGNAAYLTQEKMMKIDAYLDAHEQMLRNEMMMAAQQQRPPQAPQGVPGGQQAPGMTQTQMSASMSQGAPVGPEAQPGPGYGQAPVGT